MELARWKFFRNYKTKHLAQFIKEQNDPNKKDSFRRYHNFEVNLIDENGRWIEFTYMENDKSIEHVIDENKDRLFKLGTDADAIERMREIIKKYQEYEKQ